MRQPVDRRVVIAASITTVGVTIAGKLAQAKTTAPPVTSADMARYEKYMRLAIAQADRNPARPFGSIIVDERTGDVVGQGVVNMAANPMFHSEVVAMNDYIAHHGNQGWEHLTM